ncbi:hypothetical protein [Paenibacillus larvae]|nr:hypothetical protein [Paenibacillus larvae]MDT2232916.1 hypothetical protein [Paenibacillus larvae]
MGKINKIFLFGGGGGGKEDDEEIYDCVGGVRELIRKEGDW